MECWVETRGSTSWQATTGYMTSPTEKLACAAMRDEERVAMSHDICHYTGVQRP